MSKSRIVLSENINFMLKFKLEDISVNVVTKHLNKNLIFMMINNPFQKQLNI